MTAALAPEVRDVLERSQFVGGVLTLPMGQLERKLYVAVNAALEALGGKWNKKAKGHVFASDAAAKLSAMLDSGVVPPKNPDAFFPTPADVVEQIIEFAEFGTLDRDGNTWVLEPNAGEGAIALAIHGTAMIRATVDCVEVSADRAEELSRLSKRRGLRVRTWTANS